MVTAIDLLFRGRLEINTPPSKRLEVRATDITLGKGRVTLFSEDDRGQRRVLATSASNGDELLLTAVRPANVQRVAAVFRGVDSAGEPIVVARELTLP